MHISNNLHLKVNIGNWSNIELLNKFPCNPYCFIYFNNNQGAQTSQQLPKTINENTSKIATQSVILKLPVYPVDDIIHMVLYDLVKDDTGRDQSHIYIGELQLSIFDIFKGNDNLTVYNHDYKLYDKLLEKDHLNRLNEIKLFPIGKLSLGFQLLNSHKKFDQNILNNFHIWQNKLNQNLTWKRYRTLEYNKRSKLIPIEVFTRNVENNTNNSLPSTPVIKINGMDMATENESDNNNEYDEDDDDEDEYDDELEFENDNDDDNDKITNDTNIKTTGLNKFELNSLVSALDEYDVVTDSNDQLDNLLLDDPSIIMDNHQLNINDHTSIEDEINDHIDLDDQLSFTNSSLSQSSLTDLDKSPSTEQENLDMPKNNIKKQIRLPYLYYNDKNNSNNSFVDESDYDSSNELSTNFSNDTIGSKKNNGNSSNDKDNKINSDKSLLFKPKGSKLSRLSKKTRSKYYTKNKMYNTINKDSLNFKIAKRQHSLGVISLELINIKNLPRLTNKLSKKKYVMDPFIITIFGRRVFKSSCKKHSLNPNYNEFLSFELFPHEENFNFIFRVFDKDSFSFHDEIAEYHLPWVVISQKLMNKYDNTSNIQYNKNSNSWEVWELPLQLRDDINNHTSNCNGNNQGESPILKIRINFTPYKVLKSFFWKRFVSTITIKQEFSFVDLLLILDKLGSFIDKDAIDFFARFNKLPWRGDYLTKHQLINGLETWKRVSEFKETWQCPKCFKSRISSSHNSKKSKLSHGNDIITHFTICDFEHNNKSLKPSYVSSAFASKRWFSKVLIKLSYGKYALGSNNANILVQDRNTGIVIEEKISAHVKVGMRVIYNGRSKNTKKFKKLLKSLSIKQGRKFDNPISVKQIEPFIKFHHLDMTDCLDVEYKTFNEFFYRKLKPNSRVIESYSPNVMISPTDSRCTVFSSIEKSKQIWIKSNKFTIEKLTQGYDNVKFSNDNTSIAIFRLAPQDYHRFHSPCDVTIGKPIYIEGEYYTVNPMAIRSQLDVFGENVRIIIPMKSETFGDFLMIPVGAMMVGSIILTVNENDKVRKGDEIGYFKFGGSTIILVISQNVVKFDSDLVNNSTEQIETLVSMGMSIGHTPNVKEFYRKRDCNTTINQIEKIKRKISVTAETLDKFGDTTWQYEALKKILKDDLGDDKVVSLDEKENDELIVNDSNNR